MSDPINIRRALISVYDKTGIVEFAKALHEEFGIELISTGGTAQTLKDAGLPVTLVENVTGFPELLDGRVKTLHPKIHAAILADRDNPEHMRQLKEQGIEPIDMVVVNLYPFEKTITRPDCTLEDAIEMIDIGGPCLLRAAAKNHKHVTILSEPIHYRQTLSSLRKPDDFDPKAEAAWRAERAWDVLWQLSAYNGAIGAWLAARPEIEPYTLQLRALFLEEAPDGDLRYGENPHQTGGVYDVGPTARREYHGSAFRQVNKTSSALSFNNWADASAALELCAELTRAGKGLWDRFVTGPVGERTDDRLKTGPTVCFIKHTNASGAAVDPEPLQAYRKAYLGDPSAAMGGILAANFNVNAAFAEAVMETYQRWGKDAGAGGFFVEVWIAPSFDQDAVEVIRTRKKWGRRVRLLSVGHMSVEPDPNEMDFKRIAGGVLMQNRDLVGLNEEQWKVVTDRKPTESEMDDLRLAWLICKHTRSNAITVCSGGMLIGNGAGQMSRVMSCRIATWLAKENGHEEKLKGAVAASDAFFPFRDGPDILMDAGVTALIQPGGSKRDQEVIDACNERGAAMIFTGTRHFKH